jgi:hypothetical protein
VGGFAGEPWRERIRAELRREEVEVSLSEPSRSCCRADCGFRGGVFGLGVTFAAAAFCPRDLDAVDVVVAIEDSGCGGGQRLWWWPS